MVKEIIENNNYEHTYYDKYWHQLVFGYAIYRIGQGLIHWQRIFGFGKTKH